MSSRAGALRFSIGDAKRNDHRSLRCQAGPGGSSADAVVGNAEHVCGLEELLVECADGFVAEGCVGGGGFDDALTQPTGARHTSARTGAPDDHGRPRRPCIGYRSAGSTVVAGGDVYGVPMVHIRAVFFDSGHTLMRPRGGRWFPGPRFFEICAAHDRPINDDERLQAACDTGYEFLAAHHDRVPDLAAETHQFDEYYRIVLDVLGTGRTDGLTTELAAAAVNEVNFEPYPTTASLLDELAARGTPMAVITDAWPSTRHKYAQLGFLDYFESFVISAEVGCTKPDFGIFRPALDALQLAPNEVLFIDDGPEIVAGASRLGFVAHQIDLETARVPLTTHAQILELLDA